MLRSLFLSTLGLVALAAVPAFAMDPETLVVHVPFAFSVDNTTLPAGDYRVRPLGDNENNVIEIQSVDGRHAALVLTTDASAERRGAEPKLVFDRCGKASFLRAVELPEETGASVPESRSEVTAARALASHPQQAPSRTAS